MDRDFALKHNILLKKLPCPTPFIVIDARLIALGDILEELEAVHVVLGDLTCVISFNIIHSPCIKLFLVCLGSSFIIPTLIG